MTTSSRARQDAPHVVIVGGGFAGLSALAKATRAGLHVTLIDRHPYTTFQPLLYQVATGGLNPGDITYSLRRLASNHGAAFRQGQVSWIDPEAKTVFLDQGDEISYDKLILTAGVGPNYFGVTGAPEHTHSIYTRARALATRDAIFSGLEQLTQAGDPERRFTVAVVGGGATGVELAGSLAELKSEALPTIYPELATDNFRVVLIEMSDRLLAPFQYRQRLYTLRQLRKRGVDVRLRTSVAAVSPHHIEFGDGSSLDADVVVWASGVGAHRAVREWGMPLGRGGRIQVDPTLKVIGQDHIYAAGDCCICEDAPLPQLASPAQQMGCHAVDQIVAELRGQSPQRFEYKDKGIMATIGRGAAVVELSGGPTFRGYPAWAAWVGLHLVTLLGGRNRLQTMVNMAFRFFEWPASAATIVGDMVAPTKRSRRTGKPADPAK
ncbi:NAD(P)/FAD-dependent oxidoreductase [Buchananella felis]|uniref:NAD(P)/FAD-dependent oxidoreductase n=1 Tax=Buchananella felis TaxID=3231492 RepID=UPI003529D1DD